MERLGEAASAFLQRETGPARKKMSPSAFLQLCPHQTAAYSRLEPQDVSGGGENRVS